MRTLPIPILTALLLFLLLPATARAEEVFVLDGGEVLQGRVLREQDDGLVVRLAGFVNEARVVIPRQRIVRRFVSVEQAAQARFIKPDQDDWSVEAQRSPESDLPPVWSRVPTAVLPSEEPAAHREGFFHRLSRVAVMSVPPHVAGRTTLGILLFGALLTLVTIGGRMVEVEQLGVGRTAILAGVLGAFVAANIYFPGELLRADRAVWVLPLQGVVWLGMALLLLRCGVGRAVMLFAFVLFSLSALMFSAGAILVSF